MRSSWWKRVQTRLLGLGALLVVGLTVALSGGSVATVVALEQTSQPRFCQSCHIMDPYYASWEASEHSDVGCIECHYEPGAVETFRGKLQAVSQLAKYATRTQGTKPWAEVADTSCMRSGCHSVPALEGPLSFKGVKFDHTGHLLDGRPGKRLRCVTCHSQVTQTEHFNVSESVCYTCHFMPDAELGDHPKGKRSCETCHTTPGGELEVAGRTFRHEAYVARGVECWECHGRTVHGRGEVRAERCQSCHGEVELLARYDETAFLHEAHVTDHKVECFECHDLIEHELRPLEAPRPEEAESCGSCHESPHDAAALLYAGRGAVGVENRPGRMYETRVVCEACHTGRTEAFVARATGAGSGSGRTGGSAGGSPSAGPDPHGGAGGLASIHARGPAEAGELDCLHCHGTDYAGMLARWQDAVGGGLESLRPVLDRVRDALPADGDEARALTEKASRNIELVSRDGSRGAHNVDYALDALEVAARHLQRASELVGVEPGPDPAAAFPFRSEHGCSTCHLGVEGRLVSTDVGRSFPHGSHLRAGLDCSACHSVAEERHGMPSPDRADCTSCHHGDASEAVDPYDCQSCHETQEAFFAGEVADFEPLPAPMYEKECTDCHGEPGSILIPPPALCALCHDEDYEPLPERWTARSEELLDRAESLRATARDRGVPAGDRAEADRRLELVRADGSRGVHHFELTERLLEEALDLLGGP